MLPVKERKTLVKPGALRPGDRVGIVAPSSRPATPATVAAAERVIREMGLNPVLGKNILNVHGYMAGTDNERMSDFQEMLDDNSIKGLFCITSGFGAMHLLPLLDYHKFSRNPKVIVGCGENSVLLNAIYERSGLVTFHGPNLDEIDCRETFERVKNSLTSSGTWEPLSSNTGSDTDVFRSTFYCPVPGDAEGHLIGGNLTALVSLLGTPYEPKFSGSILLLDDVHEQTGILDRWFTTLYLAGHLQTCKAVALGMFEECGPSTNGNMMSVMDMFSDRLKYLGTPSCFGLPVGQTKVSNVVPFGIKARLFAAAGRLEFCEPALS